jgi:hypothetical protein
LLDDVRRLAELQADEGSIAPALLADFAGGLRIEGPYLAVKLRRRQGGVAVVYRPAAVMGI